VTEYIKLLDRQAKQKEWCRRERRPGPSDWGRGRRLAAANTDRPGPAPAGTADGPSRGRDLSHLSVFLTAAGRGVEPADRSHMGCTWAPSSLAVRSRRRSRRSVDGVRGDVHLRGGGDGAGAPGMLPDHADVPFQVSLCLFPGGTNEKLGFSELVAVMHQVSLLYRSAILLAAGFPSRFPLIF